MPTLNELPGTQELDSVREGAQHETETPYSSESNVGEASFLGLTLHPRSLEELNRLVEQGVAENSKWIITNHNLHSIYLFHREQKLREFYASARWTFIDGMALIALGRFYGYPLKREQRVTLADWTHPLMELAARKKWRVFYVGSAKGVAERAAEILRSLYSGLQIEVSDGYFDATAGSVENEALLQRINRYQPNVLMVGMSMPRQEYWTFDNCARIDAGIILSSNGAALDYIAGAVKTPPRWLGQMGLEWAYRLIEEPKRLFGRYLIEPWYILGLIVMNRLRGNGETAHLR